MDYSEDQTISQEESSRLRDLKVVNENKSKLDVRYDEYAEDIESTLQSKAFITLNLFFFFPS